MSIQGNKKKAVGILLGIGVGVALGVALDSIPIGVGVGFIFTAGFVLRSRRMEGEQ